MQVFSPSAAATLLGDGHDAEGQQPDLPVIGGSTPYSADAEPLRQPPHLNTPWSPLHRIAFLYLFLYFSVNHLNHLSEFLWNFAERN